MPHLWKEGARESLRVLPVPPSLGDPGISGTQWGGVVLKEAQGLGDQGQRTRIRGIQSWVPA